MQGALGSRLLGLFLAAAFGRRKPAARMPHFHFKYFLVIGAGFLVDTILDAAQRALLQPLLQRGFVIGTMQALVLGEQRRLDQGAAEKRGRGGKTGVEINRTDDGFVGIREQTFLFAPAGFLLTRAEAQMSAQMEALRGGVNGGSAHKLGQTFGKLSGVPIGKQLEEVLANHQTEDAISEKFEAFVVDAFRILAMRTMRESAFQAIGMGKPMAENHFQTIALVDA